MEEAMIADQEETKPLIPNPRYNPVKAAAARLGCTQTELANRLCVPQRTLSQWATKGVRIPFPLTVLNAIAAGEWTPATEPPSPDLKKAAINRMDLSRDI